MKLVFYSVVLNQHQAPVADALYKLLSDGYTFVETTDLHDGKGSTADYSGRSYLLQAWRSEENFGKAMELAQTADCCVFSGVAALPFQKARMAQGLLSFDMSERWLKRGIVNVLSPTILKMLLAYHLGGWNRKPLYKLCCSAFAASDQRTLFTFKGKCYKWGYFTRVGKIDVEASSDVSTLNITPLMWCSRYLMLKHPELPILMARQLKNRGYRFVLDMYGSGEYELQAQLLAKKLDVEDVVRFMGSKPNDELLADMRRHDIFLFTSDRNEGWGAVANESLANGCVLVASETIGSIPYLLADGVNGFSFTTPKTTSSFGHPDRKALDDLIGKVTYLLDNRDRLCKMKRKAVETVQSLWSPQNAAESLLQLIDDLKHGRDTSISEGPCSKA